LHLRHSLFAHLAEKCGRIFILCLRKIGAKHLFQRSFLYLWECFCVVEEMAERVGLGDAL